MSKNHKSENQPDPDVAKVQEEFAELMTAFDNHGISIDESQWAKFKPDEKHVACRWLNERREGKKRIVPPSLIEFASPELMKELEQYQRDEAENRKLLARCKFGKFSMKPKQEDGSQKLTLSIKVPHSQFMPDTAAYLFTQKNVKIELSRREVGEWKQASLPTMGGIDRKIFDCTTRVMTYRSAAGHWHFTILVSTEQIAMLEANELMDKEGSCRIEVLGEATSEDGDEIDDTEAEEPEPAKPKAAKSKAADKSKNRPKANLDEDGQFVEYDEYRFEFKLEGAEGTVRLAHHDGNFYSASTFFLRSNETNKNKQNEVFGLGSPMPNSPRHTSIQNALSAEIGTVIDEINKWADFNFKNEFLNEVKDCLNAVEKGKIPPSTPYVPPKE